MSEIPTNTSPIFKFLTSGFRGSAAYREACIRHGMRTFGKTKKEAEMTEVRCLMLAGQIEGSTFDQSSNQREMLFELRTAYAESAKSRHLWKNYVAGNVVEIGSGGMPCCEHAIQCELSDATYNKYNSGQQQEFPAQWRSDKMELPFKDGMFDCTFSSHLLEDFADWLPPLKEWTRIVRVGGHIVILLPDKEAWARAIRNGQPPNMAHKHEAYPGELTEFFKRHFSKWQVIEDRLLSELTPDYTIMFVAKRTP